MIRELLFRMVLVTVSVLVALSLVESGLRLKEGWGKVELTVTPKPKLSGKGVDYFWIHDPLIGWRNLPNAEDHYVHHDFGHYSLVRINSKGLRDDEYDYEKPAGTFRILLIGDSYPVGFEVEESFVVDKVVERKLAPHMKVQVINAGVRGYGTDQAYLYLQSEGYKYQPDLVVYFFTGNDQRNNMVIHKPYRKFGKPSYVLENGELTLTGTPVPKEFHPFGRWKMSFKPAEVYYNKLDDMISAGRKIRAAFEAQLPPPPSSDFRIMRLIERAATLGLPEPKRSISLELRFPRDVWDYQWELAKAIAGEMRDWAESHGMKFALYEVTIGHNNSLQPSPIQKASEELGLNFIHTRKRFWEVAQGSRELCYEKDLHWNEKGHELAGSIIADYVLSLERQIH